MTVYENIEGEGPSEWNNRAGSGTTAVRHHSVPDHTEGGTVGVFFCWFFFLKEIIFSQFSP